LREAENIHPNLTDFIEARVLETFNSGTNLLTTARVAGPIYVKLAFLSGRFLCVSYGTAFNYGPYDYVLIYDTTLRRWGKLKITHYDLFTDVDASNMDQSIYAMKTNGSCTLVTLDGRVGEDAGVAILGRYQLTRSSQICSQELELEVLDEAETLTVDVATNYNGTTVGQILPMFLNSSTQNYRGFQKQIEGENLSFIIKGSFNLASALFTFTKGGRM
jgi:hypothetical protein